MAGLTVDGFVPKTLEELREELTDRFKTAFGQNIKTDDRSVFGQIIGICAEMFADVWAEQEASYAAAYPDGADGSSLDDLVALAAIARLPATNSVATLTLAGTNGTVIPAGSVTTDEDTEQSWIHAAEVTIGGGTAEVEASPAETGPIPLQAGSTLGIGTPISGWTSVTIAADAELGRSVERDAALRERYALSMRAGPGNSIESIRAAVLRLDDVTECLVIENETAAEDDEGRPPKSFEVVVRGGDDQEIFDTIWDSKPAGIETYGTETGSVADAQGDTQAVFFTRPTEVPMYIDVELEALGDFEDDGIDQILAAILEYGATFTVGQDVIPFAFIQHIEVPNIRTLTMRVGITASPPSSEPYTISRTSLATFDSTRVAIERTN